MNYVIILIALLCALFLIHQPRSAYTLPSGAISLMSLQEFASVPADIKALYNDHVTGHIAPLVIQYATLLIDKKYAGGLAQFKLDVVTAAGRLDTAIRDGTARLQQEPGVPVGGYTTAVTTTHSLAPGPVSPYTIQPYEIK